MATQYKKIYQRQADRSTLDSIIREKFLSFDTTNDYILYSKDGNNYIEFYNKSNVDSISATLNSRINLISSGTYLPLSGGTITGQLNGTSISATSNVQIDGSLTVGNLSANGFVRSNSSGLLTTSPLTSGELPNHNQDFSTITNRTQDINAINERIETGFYQNNAPLTTSGWPVNGSWWHLLNLTHANITNYYSLQLAADFFKQDFRIRSTNNIGLQSWSTIYTSTNLPSVLSNYLPLSGGTLSGQFNGTSISASGNISASSFIKNGGTSAQVLLANGSVIATSALGSPVVSAFRKHDYLPTLTESNQMLHTVNCPANFWTNGYVEIRDTIQVKNISTDSRSMGWGIYLNESADLFFKNEVDPATDTKYLIDLMINKVGTEASNTYLRCTGKIENITAGTVEYVDNIAYMNNTVFTAPTTISLDASTAYSTRIRLNLISGLGKTWY